MLVLNPALAIIGDLRRLTTPNRQVMLEVSRRFRASRSSTSSPCSRRSQRHGPGALAIQYVFLFTLSRVVVLLAAVQATREERRFEVALLRTLGATRRRVLRRSSSSS